MRRSLLVVIVFLAFSALWLRATTHFVRLDSPNPTSPYTNWDTAAHTIQDAIDAATDGDFVLVTNGVYNTGGHPVHETLTNRVAITKALTVQSVNGPAVTTIEGYQLPGITNGPGAVRCVYMTNNTALIGFTITHGATDTNLDFEFDPFAGGVSCENFTNSVLSNCVIIANSGYDTGGVGLGTLNNCIIASNSDYLLAGGDYGSTLYDCTVIGNSSTRGAGGVYGDSGTSGSFFYPPTVANNCTIISNSSANGYGAAQTTMLNNCIIVGNQDLGASGCWLDNCTVVSNSIGISYSGAKNSIIYYNTNGNYAPSDTFHLYCCTTPPSSYADFGNITNEPAFVDLAKGDFHLQPGSPCINSGNNIFLKVTNNFAMPPDQFVFTFVTNDLDGNPRVAGGTVDMGAYEFQTPASTISYAWLQQYGFPTDGSADYADPDGDGMNNWQEWRAGTDPTNASSLLRMLSLAQGVPGVTVKWQGETNTTYFLQRGSDFASPFSIIQSNIVGQTGTNIYADTNAIGDGPYFYRIGVQ